VHKGNIMKFTEGAFRDWGYELAKREFGAVSSTAARGASCPNGLVVKDAIAGRVLQQILTRPGRLRRDRDAEPQRRLHLRRRWRRRSAASGSRRAATSTT
jgi:hypothetical protein